LTTCFLHLASDRQNLIANEQLYQVSVGVHMCVWVCWASAPLRRMGLRGGTGVAMAAQLLGGARCHGALGCVGDGSLLGHSQPPTAE